MDSPSHIVLQAIDASIGYVSKKGKKVIASELDLAFPKGKFIGLVGINGSGKSTLLRTLAGLQEPLQGEVLLRTKKLQHIPTETLAKKVSIVLTGQMISKNLSVEELVALGRQPYTNWLGKLTETDHTIINDAIEATELTNLRTDKCHTLSDGQLQRALIARALAQDTDIILLDEPTTHLDLHHKASVLKILRQICQQLQKTIVFSTHDIDMVLPLCDEIILMHNRKAVMDSPTNLIKNGFFEQIFPEKIIGFDRKTKRFFLRD